MDRIRRHELGSQTEQLERIARALVADSNAADELLQDAWLVALERRPREIDRKALHSVRGREPSATHARNFEIVDARVSSTPLERVRG